MLQRIVDASTLIMFGAAILLPIGMGIAHDMHQRAAICGVVTGAQRAACEGQYAAFGADGARDFLATYQEQ